MNAIEYAIHEIHSSIPYELLYGAFTIDEQDELKGVTSLDEKITRKLIKKRILLDANVVGGMEAIIPLNDIPPTHTNYYYTVYNIPNELTGNKEILSVMSLAMSPLNNFYYSGYGNAMTGNSIMNVADRIGNSQAPGLTYLNAHTEIIGYNSVLVQANFSFLRNVGMRVLLENDSNLNNIQPRSYKNLGILCTLGCKAYIYNKLIVPMNSGYLAAGQELGIYKTLVESFESANEDYNTYLREVWSATAYMNDTTRYNRFIASMLVPNL